MPSFRIEKSLYGENFFFFGGEKLIDFLEILVVELLNQTFGILLDILGHSELHCLFKTVDCIAASVTYRYLGVFSLAFRLLHECFTTLLGKRRD